MKIKTYKGVPQKSLFKAQFTPNYGTMFPAISVQYRYVDLPLIIYILTKKRPCWIWESL